MLHKEISFAKMTLGGFSFTEMNDISAETAGQDQTARICSLILLYTLRKKKRTWSQQKTKNLKSGWGTRTLVEVKKMH